MHDSQHLLLPLYSRLPTALLILDELKANDRQSCSDNRVQVLHQHASSLKWKRAL